MMDPDSFDVLGKWEIDRGPQTLAYDFWWHLGFDTLISSEWGTPNMVKHGVNPEILLAGGYGHQLHVWDLRRRRHQQALDLGKEQQMTLELRPAHDPTKAYGFLGVVVSLADLSSSIWLWHRDNGTWAIRKIIEIPAERPIRSSCRHCSKASRRSRRSSPTSISRSTTASSTSRAGAPASSGSDVSDPFKPKLTGSVHIGGIVRHTPHPQSENAVERRTSDGRGEPRRPPRVFTNSLYVPWDEQFYPDGIRGWMVKMDAKPEGGIDFDRKFFLDFGESRPHQVRLEGGDASSDSYCYA